MTVREHVEESARLSGMGTDAFLDAYTHSVSEDYVTALRELMEKDEQVDSDPYTGPSRALP